MKQVSKEKFEEYVQEIINKKMTRKQLIEILQSDSRTVNKKIQELAGYNPDLYQRFIEKYPYSPKQRTDIDYEALVIDMLQKELMTEQASEIYGVSVRTITRRITDLEKDNPNLISIYRQAAEDKKRGRKHSEKLQKAILELVPREVIISDKVSQKKEQLLKIERIYNQRCNIVEKQEAAKSMGYTYNRIQKLLNELYRIQIEEHAKQNEVSFKQKLKVKIENPNVTAVREKINTTNEREEEK